MLNIECGTPAGGGVATLKLSRPLGSKIWIHSVSLFCCCGDIAAVVGGFIYICRGGSQAATANQIVETWETLIENNGGLKKGLYWVGNSVQWYWSLERLFEGDMNRIAVVVDAFAAAPSWVAHVGVELSEV
jgi:hypothetical protein